MISKNEDGSTTRSPRTVNVNADLQITPRKHAAQLGIFIWKDNKVGFAILSTQNADARILAGRYGITTNICSCFIVITPFQITISDESHFYLKKQNFWILDTENSAAAHPKPFRKYGSWSNGKWREVEKCAEEFFAIRDAEHIKKIRPQPTLQRQFPWNIISLLIGPLIYPGGCWIHEIYLIYLSFVLSLMNYNK